MRNREIIEKVGNGLSLHVKSFMPQLYLKNKEVTYYLTMHIKI